MVRAQQIFGKSLELFINVCLHYPVAQGYQSVLAAANLSKLKQSNEDIIIYSGAVETLKYPAALERPLNNVHLFVLSFITSTLHILWSTATCPPSVTGICTCGLIKSLPDVVDYEDGAVWHHGEVGRVIVRKYLHVSDTQLILRAAVQHWPGKRGGGRYWQNV